MTSASPSGSGFKQASAAFLVTFLIMELLFSTQFIYHYRADIFEKNLSFTVIGECVILTFTDMISVSLPGSILTMAIVYCRQRFREGGRAGFNLKNGMLFPGLVAVICFSWVAFFSPANNKKLTAALYDIQMAPATGELQRTEREAFNNIPKCQHYFRLGESIDVMMAEGQLSNDAENPIASARKTATIHKLNHERARMIGFPILVLILFYAGMFIAILYYRARLSLLLAFAGFFMLPALYALSFYFETRVRLMMLSPFLAQLYYLSVVTFFTAVLLYMTIRRIPARSET